MKILPNRQLKDYLLERLVAEYIIEKPFPHLTEVIYCLTRSYYDRIDPLPPSEHELVLFAVGFGLERVLLSGLEPEKYIVDGMHITPDFLPGYEDSGIHGELKSTRMWAPKPGEAVRVPDTWVRQTQGYCKATGTTDYDLSILYIGPAVLESYRLQYTQEEIDDNWTWVMDRKDIYLGFMTGMEIPAPFKYCQDWECKNCRYRLRCDVLARENKVVKI